jgi:hypothetical protein
MNTIINRYDSMQSYLDIESDIQRKYEEEQIKANLNVELSETERETEEQTDDDEN